MNVDALARWYRWIEYLAFGRALERARFQFLGELRGARRILVFGEGDGRALERILAIAPEAKVDVIELSAEMIALARQRIGINAGRVEFHRIDARTNPWPSGMYDAVVMNFFLDCFCESEAELLTQKALAKTNPNGIWLVTDFAIPEAGWRRWHALIYVTVMYSFFRATTGLQTQLLPDINRLLRSAGLSRLDVVVSRGGLIRAESWSIYDGR